MKRIKYQIMTEINRGTEETPDIQQVFNACEIRCPDNQLEANLALARAEAYSGEVTVEDTGDDTPAPEKPLPLCPGVTAAPGSANTCRRSAGGLVVVSLAVTSPGHAADLPEGYRPAAAVSSGDITVRPDGSVWAAGSLAGTVCFYAA